MVFPVFPGRRGLTWLLMIAAIPVVAACTGLNTQPGGGSACAATLDCPLGNVCVAGRCQAQGLDDAAAAECRTTNDCPGGKVCENGKCVGEEESRGGDGGMMFTDTFSADRPAPDAGGGEASCEETCKRPNATTQCIAGICRLKECLPGFFDANGAAADGCEKGCDGKIGDQEKCDGKDNDCDGAADNGFDLNKDATNCGSCGNICPQPANSVAVCAAGKCSYRCLTNFFDRNKDPKDGCETSECSPTADRREFCDGLDNDCDSTTPDGKDESRFEEACQVSGAKGACIKGVLRCIAGDWVCESRSPPESESCNGQDDDCDGLVDEEPKDCPAPSTCSGGSCSCTPRCQDRECGSNGCGGSCGTCPAGLLCSESLGKCVSNCTPQCAGKECGSDGCGGQCGTCKSGARCESGVCKCTPQCAGKECGSDGCGGQCGTCAAGKSCINDKSCQCVPNCSGKECGPDGCGGTCGSCPGGKTCQGSSCNCVPNCTGKACGSDGCGGSCGTCPGGQPCNSLNQCGCLPNCTNKKCGSDGCGGSCGNCPTGQTCSGNTCLCQPNCTGKACGSDGCGGQCGICPSGQSCSGNSCVCQPGSCGGSCGSCPGGGPCVSGKCKCPSGWDVYNNHCYKFYQGSYTAQSALTLCQSTPNAHPVTVTSSGEQSFINGLSGGAAGSNCYWMGAQNGGGGGQWITGEPFSYTNFCSVAQGSSGILRWSGCFAGASCWRWRDQGESWSVVCEID